MENEIDPPSIIEDEDYFENNMNDNNIITSIPINDLCMNKNIRLEKSASKSKIMISAIDKKRVNEMKLQNSSTNNQKNKDTESIYNYSFFFPINKLLENSFSYANKNSVSGNTNIYNMQYNTGKVRNLKSTEKFIEKEDKLSNSNSSLNKKENPLNKIKNFEKNLNKNFEYNFEKNHDSDVDEDTLEDENFLYDPLTDKNQIINRCIILQDKIKEKANQINLLQNNLEDTKKRQKEILDSISKEQTTDIKDKKLIELAKKNSDLKLIIEKYKLKEKEYEKKIQELNLEITNLTNVNLNSEKNLSIYPSCLSIEEINPHELKKKLKTTEAKVADIRNKLQLTKEENSKLNILIKREVGENIDLDKALKDKNYWKGRSEIIESLKTKIKILESQIFVNNTNPNLSTNNLSIISEEGKNNQNVKNGIISQNKQNLSTINNPSLYQEYKKEKENMKLEIDKLKEENSKFSTDNNRLKSRKDLLEKEIKQQKEDLTGKIKILLEKSDNDEKLIIALNNQLEKKGSALFSNPNDENSNFNLQQETIKLRNEIKEKDNYINNINCLMMGEVNQSARGDNQSGLQNISRLIVRMKELEEENKKLKLKSDDGKIYEALAKENAKMRLKVKELEDKLCER